MAASNNSLFQDSHSAPNRRSKITHVHGQLTSTATSNAVAGIFADAGVSQPTIPSPLSGQNATQAKNAIDYVAKISTVSAYWTSDLYVNPQRDETGRLVDATLSAQGSVLKKRLQAYRDMADRRHNAQLAEHERRGRPLSEVQQNAQLAKHMLAALHETAEEHRADQMPTNCYEKALLSFECIAKLLDNPQLDVVGLAPTLPFTATHVSTGQKIFLPRGPDHTVLIIGRLPQSDVTAANTWGPNAIICDASKNEFYSALEIKSRFARTVVGSTVGALIFERVISLPENTPYDPNPSELHDIPADQAAFAGSVWVAVGQADTDTGVVYDSDNEMLVF